MHYIYTFILLFGFWLLMSGKFDLFHLTLGIISSALVTWMSSDLLFKNRIRTGRLAEVGVLYRAVIDVVLDQPFRIDVGFAKEPGVVTRLLKMRGHRFEISVHRKAVSRQSDVSGLPCVESGQKRGSRRAADRIRHVGTRVTDAPRRQRIQMRRMDALLAVAAQVIAVVFRDNKQNVGAI